MRVVITGTRDGRCDVRHWMERFVRTHGVPELFVLGCASGVDTVAWLFCEKRRWAYVRIFADLLKPSPQRYHDRNQRMADLVGEGDWCLAFPVAGSRGTWDCLHRCKERGARATQLPLNTPDVQKLRALAPF